jgi:hypothetical protein
MSQDYVGNQQSTERWVAVSALCSTTELAKALGVPRTKLHRWVERRAMTQFPEPVYAANPRYHVYDMDEVKRWYSTWTATRRPRVAE